MSSKNIAREGNPIAHMPSVHSKPSDLNSLDANFLPLHSSYSVNIRQNKGIGTRDGCPRLPEKYLSVW